MKLLLVVIIAVALFACNKKAEEPAKDVQEVAEHSIVPELVQIAFDEKYPEADDVEWKVDEDDVEVKFTFNGKEYEAEFDLAGTWIETETKIEIGDLTEEINKTINKLYPEYEIQEVESMESAEYGNVYEVEMQKKENGKEYEIEIIIDKSGKIIKTDEELIEKKESQIKVDKKVVKPTKVDSVPKKSMPFIHDDDEERDD